MEQNSTPTGVHTAEGFKGTSPAFETARQAARAGGFAGTNDHGMPVSKAVMEQRGIEQFQAAYSAYFDFKHNVPNVIDGGNGSPIHVDTDPAGYLRSIGWAAVNHRGEEVTPTPEQAKQIAAAIRNNDMMNHDYPGAATGVSANDPALPPHLARVTGRRLY